MKKPLLTTALLLSLLSGVSFCQAATEEEIELPTVAIVPAHNYFADAFDIASYASIDNARVLSDIYRPAKESAIEYRSPPLSYFPEDDWKTACDILQTLCVRNMPLSYSFGEVSAKGEFDSVFSLRLSEVEAFRKGIERDEKPKDFLLYHWKQVAWVNTDEAD